MSPFPLPVTQLPTLGQFISNGARTDGTQNQITKETALECVCALRKAGWQPPPRLVAMEVAAEAAVAAGVTHPGLNLGDGSGGVKRNAPNQSTLGNGSSLYGQQVMGDAAAAQAALAALAPMMAAAAAAEQASVFANAEAVAARASSQHGDEHDYANHRTKKTKTTHAHGDHASGKKVRIVFPKSQDCLTIQY